MKKILLAILIGLNWFSVFSQCTPNITDSLIAQWNFSGNVLDSSGNGHNGTIVGTLMDTVDRCNVSNSCYTSFPIYNYIDVPDAQTLRLNNTDYSISVWIYMTDTLASQNGVQTILSKRTSSGGGQHGYILYVSASSKILSFQVSGGNNDPYFFAKCPITLNTWEHFVVIYYNANEEAKIYMNAKLNSDTTGIPSPNAASNSSLRIGNDAGGQNYDFHGRIDDIRIYNRALDSCDVDSLFRLKCTIIPPTPCGVLTGLSEYSQNDNVNIFPNPSHGKFMVSLSSFPKEKTTLIIKNTLGQNIQTINLSSQKTKIELTQPSGIYFLTVTTGKEIYMTRIFVQ